MFYLRELNLFNFLGIGYLQLFCDKVTLTGNVSVLRDKRVCTAFWMCEKRNGFTTPVSNNYVQRYQFSLSSNE